MSKRSSQPTSLEVGNPLLVGGGAAAGGAMAALKVAGVILDIASVGAAVYSFVSSDDEDDDQRNRNLDSRVAYGPDVGLPVELEPQFKVGYTLLDMALGSGVPVSRLLGSGVSTPPASADKTTGLLSAGSVNLETSMTRRGDKSAWAETVMSVPTMSDLKKDFSQPTEYRLDLGEVVMDQGAIIHTEEESRVLVGLENKGGISKSESPVAGGVSEVIGKASSAHRVESGAVTQGLFTGRLPKRKSTSKTSQTE